MQDSSASTAPSLLNLCRVSGLEILGGLGSRQLQGPECGLVHVGVGRGRTLKAQVDGLQAALDVDAKAHRLPRSRLTGIFGSGLGLLAGFFKP